MPNPAAAPIAKPANPAKPTTGSRIRTYTHANLGVPAGKLGVVVSGPSENRLFRIELDEPNEGRANVCYLFADEFEVIQIQ